VCVTRHWLDSTGWFISAVLRNWAIILALAMLWGELGTWKTSVILIWVKHAVIIIVRLHAMHQRSTNILTFLIVIFLANNVFNVVAVAITTMHTSGGTPNCRRQDFSMRFTDKYQRNSFSLGPISARLATQKTYFYFPLLGYSLLCGRYSHCVSQSGLR
jgi:hypothetical protein